VTNTPLATQPAAPTATAAAQATATWQGASEVLIYLIALEDDGASGPRIGCGDSIIAVRRQLAAPTQSPLRAAYEELLSMNQYFYGESGLVNPLEPSSLTVDSVNIRDGIAIVELSGTLQLVGTCEDARIQAQLEYTALQFSTVQDVQVTINGTLLDDLISQR
jgi:spore germination protein GerM